ncbi:MAG: hypothetical protein AB7P20_09400 [Rhizobiaceae bacterium]
MVLVLGQPDNDVSACGRPDATRRPFARRIAKTLDGLVRFACPMRILTDLIEPRFGKPEPVSVLELSRLENFRPFLGRPGFVKKPFLGKF